MRQRAFLGVLGCYTAKQAERAKEQKAHLPCRVPRRFEPALAGGSLARAFALTEAYCVGTLTSTPYVWVLAQNRCADHAHGRLRLLYHASMGL